MMKKILKLIIILFLLAQFIFPISPALAKEKSQIEVFPNQLFLAGSPLSSVTGTLTIKNISSNSLFIHIYATDIIQTLGGEVSYGILPESDRYTCARWFAFEPIDLMVGPGKKSVLNYTLKVSSGTQANNYAAIIFIETKIPEGSSKGTQLNIGERIGVPAKITVERVTQGSLNSLKVPKFVDTGDLGFVVNISNTGTTLLRPKIKIELYRGNKLIKEVDWPYFEVGFKETKDMEYVLKETPFIGFYKARLTFWDGGGGKEVVKEVSFFVFPITYFVIILVLTGLGVLGYKLYRRKFCGKLTKIKNKVKKI